MTARWCGVHRTSFQRLECPVDCRLFRTGSRAIQGGCCSSRLCRPRLWVPAHNGVGRTCDRLSMGPYGRKPKPLVEPRISTVECLQITLDTRLVSVHEGRFHEAPANTLALGRRRHSDNG